MIPLLQPTIIALQPFNVVNVRWNNTPCEYLRDRHRLAMCVSLPMNASCCVSVLPSAHDCTYRACDTSITASGIAPARPIMLSIALVCISYVTAVRYVSAINHEKTYRNGCDISNLRRLLYSNRRKNFHLLLCNYSHQKFL